MFYKEYKPSKEIEHIVEAYWTFSDMQETIAQTILPDGCADIIFNLSNINNFIQKKEIIITGMMTKYLNVQLNRKSKLLGIRFRTGQLSRLTNHSLYEIKNRIVEVSELIKEFKHFNLEAFTEQNTIEKKIKFIEEFIFRILYNKNDEFDYLTNSIVDFLLTSHPKIRLIKIAKHNNISLRQLERKFNTSVGVTLKEFKSIVRFNKTVKCISNNPKKSLLHIALENGYFDHSHLTNEFKRISGQLPTQFR